MWDSVGSDTGAGPHEGGPHGVGSGQRLLGFSKHRDMTYQEVLDQEPGFCDWAILQSQGADPGPLLLEFVQWLQGQGLPSGAGGAPASGGDLAFGDAPRGWGTGPPAVGPSGDSGQRLLGFSKHRDMTYQEMRDQEPGFCDWAIRQSQGPEPGPLLLEFVQWLQGQGLPSVGGGTPANDGFGPGGDSSHPTVGFGKHRGMTYEEALEQQKGYCQWVVQRFLESDDNTPAMAEFARWLQEQGVEPRT
jgi:hypothetical protein